MESLKQTLDRHKAASGGRVNPAARTVMQHCIADLKASGIEAGALAAGDTMPDFELPDQHGNRKRFYDYLKASRVVLNIYRGGWCPYCNLEMKALAGALPAIREKGVNLVAMSPEVLSKAEATANGSGIGIDILSDAGNVVSQKLGLVFELPEALRPIYRDIGIDLAACNGDETFRLPVPATYIVEQDGCIRYAYVNADYTQRIEPSDIIARL